MRPATAVPNSWKGSSEHLLTGQADGLISCRMDWLRMDRTANWYLCRLSQRLENTGRDVHRCMRLLLPVRIRKAYSNIFWKAFFDDGDMETLWIYGEGVHWSRQAETVCGNTYQDGEFHMLEMRSQPGVQYTTIIMGDTNICPLTERDWFP